MPCSGVAVGRGAGVSAAGWIGNGSGVGDRLRRSLAACGREPESAHQALSQKSRVHRAFIARLYYVGLTGAGRAQAANPAHRERRIGAVCAPSSARRGLSLTTAACCPCAALWPQTPRL